MVIDISAVDISDQDVVALLQPFSTLRRQNQTTGFDRRFRAHLRSFGRLQIRLGSIVYSTFV